MAYKKVPSSHTEFGGAEDGLLIDAQRRADRDLRPEEQLWEIYATDPVKGDETSKPETANVDAMPRTNR